MEQRGDVTIGLVASLLLTLMPLLVVGRIDIQSVTDHIVALTGAVIAGFTLHRFIVAPLQRMDRRSSHIPEVLTRLDRIEQHVGLEAVQDHSLD